MQDVCNVGDKITEMIMMIADTCGVCGMSFFLFAEVKQIIKIYKTLKVTDISWSAYMSKIVAIAFTSVMLLITTLYLSLAVILVQGILVSWVAYLIKKYRR